MAIGEELSWIGDPKGAYMESIREAERNRVKWSTDTTPICGIAPSSRSESTSTKQPGNWRGAISSSSLYESEKTKQPSVTGNSSSSTTKQSDGKKTNGGKTTCILM